VPNPEALLFFGSVAADWQNASFLSAHNLQELTLADDLPIRDWWGGYGPGLSSRYQFRRTLTPDAFDALAEQITTSVATAERASASITTLLECTATLMKVAEQLAGYTPRVAVPINALPRSDLRLKRPPLFVSVEGDEEDGFVAEIVEAGAVGYGDTVPDAVDRAMCELLVICDDIGAADPESLGPRPRRWQAALAQLVERVP
jgi:hypothetical protein